MHRILLAVTAMSIALSGAAAGTVTVRDGWVVIDTRQSFPTLVERLEAAVKAEKIGLVTSASASEGSQGGGKSPFRTIGWSAFSATISRGAC